MTVLHAKLSVAVRDLKCDGKIATATNAQSVTSFANAKLEAAVEI